VLFRRTPKRCRKPSARRVSKASAAPEKSGSASSMHAAKVLERFFPSGQDGGNAIVHRQAAQVAAPGDADFLEVPFQALREDSPGSAIDHRRARVGAGHGREKKRRRRPTVRAIGPITASESQAFGEGHVGTSPRRRPEADDVAVVAGIAQARREVGAVAKGSMPARHRRAGRRPWSRRRSSTDRRDCASREQLVEGLAAAPNSGCSFLR